jgi:hypothetical protein
MEDWLSYRLQDFLLFDKAVYLRQFERYNDWLGLYRFSGLAAGLWILFSVFNKSSTRLKASLILVCTGWIICSYLYLWQLFRPINWTIDYVIALPALQVLLLLAAASGARAISPKFDIHRDGSGIIFLFLGFLITVASWLFGQSITFWPSFLLTPDSLALVSIGLVLTTRTPIWYSAPSFAWLVYSGLIRYSLEMSAL